MGTLGRSTAAHRRSPALRPAIVLLGGAVCAAVAGTSPAIADDGPSGPPPLALPFAPPPGPLTALPLGLPTADLGQPSPAATPFGIPDLPFRIPNLAPPVTPAPVADSDPNPTPIADSDPAAPPQAEEIRIGSVEFSRPSIVTPEQAAQFNSGTAEVEDTVSDVLDSSGMDPVRSDEVAAQMIGDAAVGAVVGGVVAAPVAAAVGAVVGGVGGFVLGIPFLPTGLVVGPVIGATMVAAFIAAPAVIAGAVIGAGVGAVQGYNAPLDPPPAP
ncbi:hypothetical protein [Nocardia bovistercoris]|uniref:Uncharacterized protein n=1 Tax=Nocardia bovistercoris TaxID=2785916 RepID=A0A931IE01_9NOCA|nr:hypothetical protein [Nocardia bovistercoris]MBH0778023.1 hypothetical protein [Nocardia bovistercoris]